MKLEELRNTKEGTPLIWSQGNGWWIMVSFKRLVKTTSFGKMTLSEFMANGLDMSKGKEMIEAMVIDQKGEMHIVSPRRLRKDYIV